jgi:hypothetical protein
MVLFGASKAGPPTLSPPAEPLPRYEWTLSGAFLSGFPQSDQEPAPLVVVSAFPSLPRLLASLPVHMEDDGETVFRHACKLGLEGIVSKRKDSAYRSGRSPDASAFFILSQAH